MKILKILTEEKKTPTKKIDTVKGWIPLSKDYDPDPSHLSPISFPVSRIIISYPLTTEAVVEGEVETVKDLIELTRWGYREVYRIEEETTEKPAQRLCDEVPGCTLLNRNRTSGEFGIWGHVMEDLVVHTWEIYDDGTVRLGVDS